MESKRIELQIGEAGCMILVAPMSLGGLAYEELLDGPFAGEGEESVRQLVERGAMMPMSLYQDDGYNVRVVLGGLTGQEEAEWTARVRGRLEIPCGKLLVTGSLDNEDGIPDAEDGGTYWLGCSVAVPPGEYQVGVYSYPPSDLSSGWGQIENSGLFRPTEGIEPEEPLAYWRRTRPSEEPPDWIQRGWGAGGNYINFIVHLMPLTRRLPSSAFETDGFLAWEFRKPEACPRGILSTSLASGGGGE